MIVGKAPKAKTRATARGAAPEGVNTGRPRGRYDEILALQRAVSNRVVNGFLQGEALSRGRA